MKHLKHIVIAVIAYIACTAASMAGTAYNLVLNPADYSPKQEKVVQKLALNLRSGDRLFVYRSEGRLIGEIAALKRIMNVLPNDEIKQLQGFLAAVRSACLAGKDITNRNPILCLDAIALRHKNHRFTRVVVILAGISHQQSFANPRDAHWSFSDTSYPSAECLTDPATPYCAEAVDLEAVQIFWMLPEGAGGGHHMKKRVKAFWHAYAKRRGASLDYFKDNFGFESCVKFAFEQLEPVPFTGEPESAGRAAMIVLPQRDPAADAQAARQQAPDEVKTDSATGGQKAAPEADRAVTVAPSKEAAPEPVEPPAGAAKITEIVVDSKVLILRVWDGHMEDQDRVELTLADGTPIHENLVLTNRPVRIPLHLSSSGKHFVLARALSTGGTFPCTVNYDAVDGEGRQLCPARAFLLDEDDVAYFEIEVDLSDKD